MHGIAVVGHMMADFQQHGDCKLAHGGSPIGGHIGQGNALFLRICIIHHIVSGGQHGNVPDRRACINHPLCDGRLVGNDNLHIPDACDGLFLIGQACAVINRYLAQFLQFPPA